MSTPLRLSPNHDQLMRLNGPNTWCSLPEGGIVARLGMNEFLIEDSWQSTVALLLSETCQQAPAKVYPVLRQDAAITLCGEAVNELLLQTCSSNFGAISLMEQPLILTTIVGVTVTIILSERDTQKIYRIWCDGTYGVYLWQTLLAMGVELGGGAVGAERFV